MNNTNLTQTIKNLHNQGWIILPTLPHRKHPKDWKQHKQNPLGLDETLKTITTQYDKGAGVCVLTGYDRNKTKLLIMLELEAQATTPSNINKVREFFKAHNKPMGWWEISNSGGLHVYVYLDVDSVEDFSFVRNMKLAMSMDNEVISETRGEGGLSVIAPTRPFNKGEKGWTLYDDDECTFVPTRFAWSEYLQLIELFATIQGVKVYDTHDTTIIANTTNNINTTNNAKSNVTGRGSVQPFLTEPHISVLDDFESKTSWEEILQPHGWQIHSYQQGGGIFWTRPNKNPSDGISASTGIKNDRDRMWVFTTSTSLETETPLTKPYVYSKLNNHTNMQETVKHLASKGYGNITPTINYDTTNEEQTLGMLGQIDIAKKFTKHTHETLKYNLDVSKWYMYDKTTGVWVADSKDNTNSMRRLLKYVETIPNQPKKSVDGTKIEIKRAKLSHQTLSGVLKLSSYDIRHEMKDTILDTHQYLINTPSGVVNLKTGEILPHDKDYYFTKTTNAKPKHLETVDTDEKLKENAPKFYQFIHETLPTLQIRNYVQTYLGYSLTGVTGENVLAFWLGEGRNGKSVLAELIIHIMGDYGGTSTDKLLVKKTFESDYEIMTLKGKRLVVMSEIDPDAVFDEQKVKKITGGDTLTGRLPYEPFTSFSNKAKVVVLANHQPTVKRGGAAFWRRMRVVDFPNIVPEDKQNPNLVEELKTEQDYVFTWLIVGAVRYYREGLCTPLDVLKATREYEQSEDHITAFLRSECEIGGGEHVTVGADVLRAVYVDFCTREGFTALDSRKLGRELLRRGITKTRLRVGGTRKCKYTNVRLKDEEGSDVLYD